MDQENELPDLPDNLPEGLRRLMLLQINRQSDLQLQVKVLRDALFRVIQQLEATKGALFEEQHLKRADFTSNLVGVMLADHSGRGADPWVDHSYYPYIVSEDEFLREYLGLDEAAIQAYKERAENLARLT